MTLNIRVKRNSPIDIPENYSRVYKGTFQNPEVYVPKDLTLWRHYNNELWADGFVVSRFLQDKNFLKFCLNENDLSSIKRKGVDFFTTNFTEMFHISNIIAWQSVVTTEDSNKIVPILKTKQGRKKSLIIEWACLNDPNDFAALMFRH